MIYEVEGDILLTGAEAIAHGIAPNDPMNQGLARSLHERFPAMHKDFHHWCKVNHPKPGSAWIWSSAEGKRIVNLITQEGGYDGRPPGKASTPNVNHSLRALKRIAVEENFTSLALPKLATGVGGLDWENVKPLLESQLGDLEIPVYVYVTFHEGVKASEPT